LEYHTLQFLESELDMILITITNIMS